MIRIITGVSGSGKTHKIMTELIQFQSPSIRKKVVIEGETHMEYSRIFNKDYVTTFTPQSLLLTEPDLGSMQKTDIYVDCSYYSEALLEYVAELAAKSRTHENTITITCMDINDLQRYCAGQSICRNADEIWAGRSTPDSEAMLEKILNQKLMALNSRFDFRRLL